MAWANPASPSTGTGITATWGGQVAGDLTIIGAAWTVYTPTWTSLGTAPALGNGTAVGYYNQIGKTVDFRFTLTFGSTSTFGTGNYYFSLPVNAAAAYSLFQPFGWALGTPAGARNSGVAMFNNASTIQVIQPGGANIWAPAYPGTWASTNYIQITGRYESA